MAALDADAALILFTDNIKTSPGTLLTQKTAAKLNKPLLVASVNEYETIFNWTKTLGYDIIMNVAGPRESEAPGVYLGVYRVVGEISIFSSI